MLNTPVQPEEVEVRVFDAVGNAGIPFTSRIETFCDLESDASVCRLDRSELDGTWFVSVRLPDEARRWFISLRGSWYVPFHSPIRTATGWPTLEAGWFFAIAAEEGGNR
jgi:hypothetical protein